jgi:hypothetical protein
MTISTDDEEDAEARKLGEQAQAAADAVRATVLRLLKEGDVHPHLIVLTVARVAGELGVSAALAAGEDIEAMLGEPAKVVRDAGREHHETLQVAMVAGRT